MARKREKPTLTAPLSSSEYDAAVAAFIRNRGVTRCPTACLVRTQASVPEADRTALEHYEAEREQSRRSHIAATARLLGVFLPPSIVGQKKRWASATSLAQRRDAVEVWGDLYGRLRDPFAVLWVMNQPKRQPAGRPIVESPE